MSLTTAPSLAASITTLPLLYGKVMTPKSLSGQINASPATLSDPILSTISTVPLLSSGLTQPAPASSYGFNRLVLWDDFTARGSIDVGNSKAPGFNWYINNGWPNARDGGGWATLDATKPGDLTISGSVLTVNASLPYINYPLQSINSAAAGAAQGTYVGKAFTGGFYAEIKMSFNPALSSASNGSWPGFFSIAVEMLSGATASEFGELDLFEAIPGNGSISPYMTFHDWAAGSSSDNHNPNYFWSAPGGFDYTQMHSYGTLWVPTAKNGGTGLVQRYVDGVHYSANDVSYTATTGSTPSAVPSNPNGVFSIMDSQHHVIFTGCGQGVPAAIDYIQVWQ